MKKRSGFTVMARLIGLVKPLSGYMVLAILTGFGLKESRHPDESMSFTRDAAASFQSAMFILLTETSERGPPASMRLAASEEQPETAAAARAAATGRTRIFIFFIKFACKFFIYSRGGKFSRAHPA